MSSRADLVIAAGRTIALGSQSFAAASKLFAPKIRDRAWLLYAWCRAADDLTDGQDLGQNAIPHHDALTVYARLEELTTAALDSEAAVPVPFAALRAVARETHMPRGLIEDHLKGFGLDAREWRPRSEEDLLRYCYYVAGAVGCMMAVVMGVHPADEDMLDRACDLGLAFQLANIARDLVADAQAGRCYIPAQWLEERGLSEAAIVDPANRPALAGIAARLVAMGRSYRASARSGAARLAPRSRLAVLAADAVYGAIGEKVVQLSDRAWDTRTRVGKPEKMLLFARAILLSARHPKMLPRANLWTRPRQSRSIVGSCD